jgi:ferredoxin
LTSLGLPREVVSTDPFRYTPRQLLYKEHLMKVRIDADLCTACGLCTDDVPDVFRMGDDVAEVIKADVPANLEGAVRDAADSCPAEAIIVE